MQRELFRKKMAIRKTKKDEVRQREKNKARKAMVDEVDRQKVMIEHGRAVKTGKGHDSDSDEEYQKTVAAEKLKVSPVSCVLCHAVMLSCCCHTAMLCVSTTTLTAPPPSPHDPPGVQGKHD